jgi:hypothetical protein
MAIIPLAVDRSEAWGQIVRWCARWDSLGVAGARLRRAGRTSRRRLPQMGIRGEGRWCSEGTGAPACPRDGCLVEDDIGWGTQTPPSCCGVLRLYDDLGIAIVQAEDPGFELPGLDELGGEEIVCVLDGFCSVFRRATATAGRLPGSGCCAGEGLVVGVGELAQVVGVADVVEKAENVGLQVVDGRARLHARRVRGRPGRPVPVRELSGDVSQRQVAVSGRRASR